MKSGGNLVYQTPEAHNSPKNTAVVVLTMQPKKRYLLSLDITQAVLILVLLYCIKASLAVAASSEPATRGNGEQQNKTPETQESGFFWDGNIRTRLEHDTWYAVEDLQRDTDFTTGRMQLGGGYKSRSFQFYNQLQYFGGLNLPDEGAGPAGGYFGENGHSNFGDVGVRQVNVTLLPVETMPLKLKFGRFLYSSGEEVKLEEPSLEWLQTYRIAQRLIGPADFTVGRSFDGILAEYGDAPSPITFFLTSPSQGANQATINPTITDIDVGGVVTNFSSESAQSQLFYYYYDDSRNILPTDNRSLEAREADRKYLEIHTLGASSISLFQLDSTQSVDLVLWAATQTGQWGGLSHRAIAAVVESGYQLHDIPWTPWIRAGWNYASGDDDPLDETHNTFSQLLPSTRRYAQIPFHNMQNMHDLFLQIIMKPSAILRLRSDIHFLRLSEGQDLLYSGAGANNRRNRFGMGRVDSAGQSSVGTVADIDITYQLSSRLSSTIYLGHLFPDSLLKQAYPPGRRDITYLLWDMTVRFSTS